MRRISLFFLMFTFAAGVSAKADAQLPMPGGPGVETLLSQTGALQLTDAQVVRLAAIARRAEDRHRALRTRLDSLRPRRAPGDSARRAPPAPPTGLFERERDAAHNDLRDALAVLSPDQQARAWEMMGARRSMGFLGPMRRNRATGGPPPMRREVSPPQRRPGEGNRDS